MLSGLGRFARAEAPPGSFSWVRAAGADTCPAREKLVEELDRALGKPLLKALEGRAVEGVIARGKSGWDVTLYWRAADGTGAGTREIHDDAEGCESAIRNVIASITVAITASAVDAPSRPVPSAAPDKPPPPPASPPKNTNSASPPPPPPTAPLAKPESGPRTGGVMLGGVVALGWLPAVAYGLQLFAEPFVSGRFRLALMATQLAETSQKLRGVEAGFAASEIGTDLCAVLLAHPRHLLDAAVCGGARAGIFEAFVYSGLQRAGGSQGAFALEGAAELRSNPLGPVTLALRASARLHTVPYVLAGATPGQPTYTQDTGGFTAILRAGVQFP